MQKYKPKEIIEPDLVELFKKTAFFDWLTGIIDPSDELILAVLTNLKLFGDAIQPLVVEMFASERSKLKLDELLTEVDHKPTASYETFALLGYDGPVTDYHNPVEEVLAQKKSLDFGNRGLYYDDKQQLRLNANPFASYVLSRLKLTFVLGQGFFVYHECGK